MGNMNKKKHQDICQNNTSQQNCKLVYVCCTLDLAVRRVIKLLNRYNITYLLFTPRYNKVLNMDNINQRNSKLSAKTIPVNKIVNLSMFVVLLILQSGVS